MNEQKISSAASINISFMSSEDWVSAIRYVSDSSDVGGGLSAYELCPDHFSFYVPCLPCKVEVDIVLQQSSLQVI